MAITTSDLEWAVSEGLITGSQSQAIREAQARRPPDSAAGLSPQPTTRQAPQRHRFEPAHIAYYLGAFIVMCALGWFMFKSWNHLGGGGVFLLSTLYGACFILAGRTLLPGARYISARISCPSTIFQT